MSDTWVAPGWWLASDGRWYPPAAAERETGGAEPAHPEQNLGAPVILDLRSSEPTVELVGQSALAPPPIPASAGQTPSDSHPGEGRGTRWGGHRRIAPPIGTSPAD